MQSHVVMDWVMINLLIGWPQLALNAHKLCREEERGWGVVFEKDRSTSSVYAVSSAQAAPNQGITEAPGRALNRFCCVCWRETMSGNRVDADFHTIQQLPEATIRACDLLCCVSCKRKHSTSWLTRKGARSDWYLKGLLSTPFRYRNYRSAMTHAPRC